MKKRIKLTKINAMIISFIMGLIFYIVCVAIKTIHGNSGNLETGVVALIILTGVLGITLVCYHILCLIFCVDEVEKRDNTFLCKEDFTEVFYRPSDNHRSEVEMISSILQTEEIKFFAKLMEDEKILLVVKNRNDEEIYSCEISNYYYFEEHFLKEKF